MSDFSSNRDTSLDWIESWKCSDIIGQIEVSYDESTMAISTFSTEGASIVYLVSKGQIVHKLQHNFPVADMKFSPNDASVLVTVSDHIRIFKWGNLSSVLSLHNEQDVVEVCPFTSIDFELSKGNLFAVCDVRGFCSVWDLSSGDDKPVEVYELISEVMYSVSFVTENIIGVVSESGSLFVIDRRTHAAKCTETGDEHSVPACQPRLLAWNHNSTMIAIAHQTSGTFSVYQLGSIQDDPKYIGSSPRISKTSGSGIATLRWVETQSGATVLLVGRDSGVVEVWNTNFGRLDAPVFEVNTGGAGVSSLSYLWKSSSVVAGLTNGRLAIMNLPDINNGNRGTRKSYATTEFDDHIETMNHYPTLA